MEDWKNIIDWESDENPMNIGDSPDAMIGFTKEIQNSGFGYEDVNNFTAVIRVIETETSDESKIATVHEFQQSIAKPVLRIRAENPEIAKQQVRTIAKAYEEGVESVRELIIQYVNEQKVDTLVELFDINISDVVVDSDYNVTFVADRMDADSLAYLSSGTPSYTVRATRNGMLEMECEAPLLL
jgi:hypothetical protein